MLHPIVARVWAVVLLVAMTTVGVMAESADGVYAPAVLAGPTGSGVTLPLAPDLWRTYPEYVVDTGRTLVQSNNPEYVTEPGIMYRDTIDGRARLNLYHATRGTGLMRYGIVLRNHTDRDVTVTITRKGVAGPGTDYPRLGLDVLVSFWEQLHDERLVVPAGEQRHLDPHLINLPAGNNALVHGRYDVETDGPLEVAFVADNNVARLQAPNLDNYKEFAIPADARMRGTYAASDRYVSFHVNDRPITLVIAGNFPPDEYMYGVDGMDGAERQNYGNYGVTYHVDVLMAVDEPQRIHLYLGPAFSGGSGSCELYPAIMLTDGAHDDDAETGRVVRLPRSKEQRAVALIGETVVLPGEPRVLRFDFMPPGGSCLPVLLFADPERITDEEAVAWYAGR